MMNDGLLVVLSGPSGAGKGTVLKSLLSGSPSVRLSVSATTRAPRPGETSGKDYFFYTREEFLKMREQGKLLESAEYCGNFYGTPAAPIQKWTEQGMDVVLEIEVKGGAQVRKKRPDSVGIFILPPSLRELEGRLRNRKTETEEAIQKRLNEARREILEAEQYDYVVINDQPEQAAEQIRRILEAEKCSTRRNAQMIERMLEHD